MSDYIDRDLLLAEIEELKKSPWYNDCGENYERIVRSDAISTVVDLCVKSAPVADVQEAKHGEWKSFHSEDTLYGSYYCSACGHEQDIGMVVSLTTEFKYCPNCGAKMDGGNNNVE